MSFYLAMESRSNMDKHKYRTNIMIIMSARRKRGKGGGGTKQKLT